MVKIIDIGDWNMDITDNLSVAHILDQSKIRTVKAFILDDGGIILSELTVIPPGAVSGVGGTVEINAGDVRLSRVIGGGYDGNTDYDAVAFNRGYIVIDYIP